MPPPPEAAVFPIRPERLAARMARQRLGRFQRFLFVCSLLVFASATSYTAIDLLTHITPALFPGKVLADAPGIGDLIDRVPIKAPAIEDTVFGQRVNLLIIGVDRRPGLEDAPPEVRFDGNTDTLMVASLDPVGKSVSFLSFPRDMVIDVSRPNLRPYQDRINASYDAGIKDGGSVDAGAHQLEKDMLGNFGIEIDHYVVMDFSGVEKLVNALGGVDVNVPDDLAIYDWWYSDDDYTGRYVTVLPGLQHLNGYTAVALGRNRDPSDFARVKRQQLVLQGALGSIISGGLLDPTSWPKLWDAYSTTVHTDMSKAQMFGIAPLLRSSVSRSKMYSVADPVNGTPSVWTGSLGDASVVYWDADNVQYWLGQAFSKAAYAESTVEIQDGIGGAAGQADSLGRYLMYSRGVPEVNLGPDHPPQPQTTITLYSAPKRVLAEDIAKWLNVPKDQITLRSKDDDPTLPDVVIVLGQDFKAPWASPEFTRADGAARPPVPPEPGTGPRAPHP